MSESVQCILRPLAIIGLLGYGGYRYASSRRFDLSLLIILAFVAYLAIRMALVWRAQPARPRNDTGATSDATDDAWSVDGGALLRGLAPSVLVNAVLPFLLYQILTARHLTPVTALTLTAVFPLAWIVATAIRARRVDMIGAISLAFIIVGVATSLIAGSTRVYLVKESFLTGIFGLACLVSLAWPRPLLFYLGRQFASGGDTARAARYNLRWESPAFRSRQRLLTAVWGGVLVGEALLRIALAFLLPTAAAVIVSPLLAYMVIAGGILWTLWYAREAQAGTHG